jgi:hypothetical protein
MHHHRKYEVVSRWCSPALVHADGTPLHPAQSWIIPASEGHTYRRTWLGARWAAYRLTRRWERGERRRARARVAEGKPEHLTRSTLRWEVRRTPTTGPALRDMVLDEVP